MSVHISKFVDRIRALESKSQRDFTMPMSDAKGLHSDITKLLLQLQEYQQAKPVASTDTVTIEVQGGSF